VTANHFLITRFSYRGKDAFRSIDGPTFVRAQDPLDPHRLKCRFRLFEFTCLPSVLGQSDQGFTWIILVDRDMPAADRRRLASLVKAKSPTIFHVYDPQESLADLQWLRDHIEPGRPAVTTNLDDDDCIPVTFVAALRRHLARLEARPSSPPIGIVGAKNAVEWDLIPSAVAPLGWKAPWHRGRWVMSVGFSLYCRVPEFDLCVLGLRHTMAERYLDFAEPPVNLNVRWFQDRVASAARANNLDVRVWRPDALFHDISEDVGPVLLANHAGNDQAGRLIEQKPGRVPVTGPDEFPAFAIDWNSARAYFDSMRDPR